MNKDATISVTIPVKQDVDVDVHVGDVIEAINKLPLSQRMNTIAIMLREIDMKSGDMTLAHCQLIVDYLEEKLSDFKDLLHTKKKISL